MSTRIIGACNGSPMTLTGTLTEEAGNDSVDIDLFAAGGGNGSDLGGCYFLVVPCILYCWDAFATFPKAVPMLYLLRNEKLDGEGCLGD